MLRTLVTLALRHYRDPLSWAGVVSALGVTFHFTIPPEYVQQIEIILGAVVSLLLLKADGRKNPNTDVTGAVSARDPAAVVVVQGEPPAASGVDAHAGAAVQPERRPDVSSANTGVRPGFPRKDLGA